MDPGDTIARHGYRGGPFVIDVAEGETALSVIEAWNEPALWDEHPWANRSVFQVVTVHQAITSFEGRPTAYRSPFQLPAHL